MGHKEAAATLSVRNSASLYGGKLFRNNSGVLRNNTTGRPVRFGLGNESAELNKTLKSPDLVGLLPVVVTHQMVGCLIGVFLSVEVKSEGFVFDGRRGDKRLLAQQKWHTMIMSNGGISGFATGPSDVDLLLSDFRKRFIK